MGKYFLNEDFLEVLKSRKLEDFPKEEERKFCNFLLSSRSLEIQFLIEISSFPKKKKKKGNRFSGKFLSEFFEFESQ